MTSHNNLHYTPKKINNSNLLYYKYDEIMKLVTEYVQRSYVHKTKQTILAKLYKRLPTEMYAKVVLHFVGAM